MENILIIEDNQDVNLMLSQAIKEAGYNVKSSFTGTDGLNEIKTNSYNLILLDIMLPYKSGDQILKEVREFSSVPIIIISAKDMISTKIDLLKLGADDYITKPFDLGEVVARVESNLRRYSISVAEPNTVFTYKDITLNTNTKEVKINGNTLDLTAKEYMILELLIKNQNKVFSKANIYESIWNEEYIGDDNAIKTHLSNLRSKLKKSNPDENYIETVWGLGYRLFKC
ncbi:MAG: response regulator transcription factor [Intestinibacter sp.]|uniref:response regulator transcription factor n=1 Tax=Intestinibacter sp. TaxID=1965304 RepID=UPI002A7FB16D|nr:response regulator transcription factor [Intestinibacter sp.]MDY4574896.1 response regulator transcription factor [Intestinibacter sp.]